MIDYRTRTALVTGASSGIGKAFAEALAARGAHLILVARSKAKLERIAAQIRKQHSVDAIVLAADLSQEKAPDRLLSAVRRAKRTVDILVNNAGFGVHGLLHAAPDGDLHRLVMLNVVALSRLTRLFLPGMVERQWGVIVNVASTAAFQPVPYMAAYGASKAFVLSLSEALWAEYRSRGIKVLALCPGATETSFFEVAGEEAAVGRKRPAEGVVRTALRALDRGRPTAVDGGLNSLVTIAVRLAPRRVVASSAARILAPKPGTSKPSGSAGVTSPGRPSAGRRTRPRSRGTTGRGSALAPRD